MRIAVIGAGVSGLVAAWLLQRAHSVTLFEANGYAGGHAHTVRVNGLALDTGFIVFNREDYPLFSRLLEALKIGSRPTRMSFAVSCERTGLEYCAGPGLNGIFAQRRNLVSPAFARMLANIVRFYREAPELLKSPAPGPTIDAYLATRGYSAVFRNKHLLPMASALWSETIEASRAFPARALVDFMSRHGMMRFYRRPQWLTVEGGSQRYVDALIDSLHERPALGRRVTRLTRDAAGVLVRTEGAETRFDAAVLACHTNQALTLLDEPSAAEHDVLSAIRYNDNDVILHNDSRLMPRRRAAWGSWNYRLPATPRQKPLVTYGLNSLQALDTPDTWCVTLNGRDRIAPETIRGEFSYSHPRFDQRAFDAQARWHEIQGHRNTWYCGAWWGYGFHEDGVRSAVRVARSLGVSW